MLVYVLNQYGEPLMPCSPGKARRLLNTQKTRVMNNAVLAKNVRYYKDDHEGVDYMCRISEEIWNDGKAEGRAEGKAEGEISGIARAVKRLMEKHDFSFAQACEEAGVTKDERPAVEKALHLS